MLRLACTRLLPQRTYGSGRRYMSSTGSTQEFKVILDKDAKTLYIDRPLAEGLGWSPEEGSNSVQLTLSGHAPKYFAIAPSGTDSDWLARGTVESLNNPNVQSTLQYLKDR